MVSLSGANRRLTWTIVIIFGLPLVGPLYQIVRGVAEGERPEITLTEAGKAARTSIERGEPLVTKAELKTVADSFYNFVAQNREDLAHYSKDIQPALDSLSERYRRENKGLAKEEADRRAVKEIREKWKYSPQEFLNLVNRYGEAERLRKKVKTFYRSEERRAMFIALGADALYWAGVIAAKRAIDRRNRRRFALSTSGERKQRKGRLRIR